MQAEAQEFSQRPLPSWFETPPPSAEPFPGPAWSTSAEVPLDWSRGEVLSPNQWEEPTWEQTPPPDWMTPEEDFQPKPEAKPANFGPPGGKEKSPVQLNTIWQPSVGVTGQDANWTMQQHELKLMAPIWLKPPLIVLMSAGVQANQFNTTAIFPRTGQPFPRELWNIRMGTTAIYQFDNDWTGGATFNFGSASDQPFGAARDLNFGLLGFLKAPSRDGNYWTFALIYSPLSQVPFPIPGATYHWEPSDTFNMDIGIPLSMTYRPTERLTLTASYMVLTTIRARASYQLTESLELYGGYEWENQSWFLQDREADRERLFTYEQRLAIGLRANPLKYLQLDLSTGYLFDRYLFTGERFRDRQNNRIELGSGIFAAASASLVW